MGLKITKEIDKDFGIFHNIEVEDEKDSLYIRDKDLKKIEEYEEIAKNCNTVKEFILKIEQKKYFDWLNTLPIKQTNLPSEIEKYCQKYNVYPQIQTLIGTLLRGGYRYKFKKIKRGEEILLIDGSGSGSIFSYTESNDIIFPEPWCIEDTDSDYWEAGTASTSKRYSTIKVDRPFILKYYYRFNLNEDKQIIFYEIEE